MNQVLFFDAPEVQTAFKVTPDCCIERVVYGGVPTHIGINAINDNEGNDLNSDNYACPECGVPFKMHRISHHDYQKKYDFVYQLQRKSAGDC
jgi:hypothetical protein